MLTSLDKLVGDEVICKFVPYDVYDRFQNFAGYGGKRNWSLIFWLPFRGDESNVSNSEVLGNYTRIHGFIVNYGQGDV